MAVTAIHHRTRRRPTSALRRISMLALVVAWAAVFALAYALGAHSSTTVRDTPASPPPTLAQGSSATARSSHRSARTRHPATIAVTGLRALPAPPALAPAHTSAVHTAAAAAPVYRPVYVPRAPAATPTTSTTSTTSTTPTGGGPHGSGGTGGGTTTVGSGNGGGTPSGGSGSTSTTGGGGVSGGSSSGASTTPSNSATTPTLSGGY